MVRNGIRGLARAKLNASLRSSVIYRDIKPENIGFDVRGELQHHQRLNDLTHECPIGDVKLFDFGLAREIPPNHAGIHLFQLTGDTGSPRYSKSLLGSCKLLARTHAAVFISPNSGAGGCVSSVSFRPQAVVLLTS